MSKKERTGQRMVVLDTIWNNPKLFDEKFEDKERSIKAVPKDQKKEGWDPLCKFLGVEKPKDCAESPRSNSTKDVGTLTRYVVVCSTLYFLFSAICCLQKHEQNHQHN